MRSRVDGEGQCRRPRWSNTLLMALRRRGVDIRQCRCNERHKPRRRAPCYILHGRDIRFAKSPAARMMLFLGCSGGVNRPNGRQFAESKNKTARRSVQLGESWLRSLALAQVDWIRKLKEAGAYGDGEVLDWCQGRLRERELVGMAGGSSSGQRKRRLHRRGSKIKHQFFLFCPSVPFHDREPVPLVGLLSKYTVLEDRPRAPGNV